MPGSHSVWWQPDRARSTARPHVAVCVVQVTAMSYVNGLGLDLKGQSQDMQEHLHLEDFKFSDLKWAKSSRMSKRWILFSLRIKA